MPIKDPIGLHMCTTYANVPSCSKFTRRSCRLNCLGLARVNDGNDQKVSDYGTHRRPNNKQYKHISSTITNKSRFQIYSSFKKITLERHWVTIISPPPYSANLAAPGPLLLTTCPVHPVLYIPLPCNHPLWRSGHRMWKVCLKDCPTHPTCCLYESFIVLLSSLL